MKKLIGILASFLILIQAEAIELKKASLLNKMSMSLTGKPASTDDQKAISGLTAESDIAQFLNSKMDQYMSTEAYSQKVTFKLYELFQFKNPDSAIYKTNDFNFVKVLPYSTNTLFNSLTKENLSWDMILLSKKYSISSNYPTGNFDERLTDFSFFNSVIAVPQNQPLFAPPPYLAPQAAQPLQVIQFDQDDTRIAGAITTPPFFARYATTGVNKNRRRAAALFRIFLCDKMSAAIPAVTGVDQTLLSTLYPNPTSTGMTETEVKAVLNKSDQIHGTRTDCKSCHYKLDPMGKVFTTSAASLGSMPSPGALVYKNSSGELVNIPVSGVGEMGEAITKQPDYVKCQINHFWNWYVGQDVPLSADRMTQLQQAFESAGRKTNDFTKVMLLSKEFATRELPNELRDLAKNVKTFMQRCQSCHSNSPDYEGADLTKWPLGKNQNDPKDNNSYWISKISEALDLTHGGLKRTMPPKPADGGFIPSRQDLDMLSNWIKNGAPDETGKPQQAVTP